MTASEDVRVAEEGAAIIHDAFRSYRERFRDITRRARLNFERRDWHAGQHDSVRRLDLYGEAVAFDYPKMVTHDEVRRKYRLVFRHDRAGRLVDAQEFEHLTFDRRRLDDELLGELTTLAAETVKVEGDRVVMLLKNFGVFRPGRLIFYDYDELCLLTDCRFRELPQARTTTRTGRRSPGFTSASRRLLQKACAGGRARRGHKERA